MTWKHRIFIFKCKASSLSTPSKSRRFVVYKIEKCFLIIEIIGAFAIL